MEFWYAVQERETVCLVGIFFLMKKYIVFYLCTFLSSLFFVHVFTVIFVFPNAQKIQSRISKNNCCLSKYTENTKSYFQKQQLFLKIHRKYKAVLLKHNFCFSKYTENTKPYFEKQFWFFEIQRKYGFVFSLFFEKQKLFFKKQLCIFCVFWETEIVFQNTALYFLCI